MTSYTPQDFAEMYDFPPGDGSGQTIAVIEFEGGYKPEDVAENFEAAQSRTTAENDRRPYR